TPFCRHEAALSPRAQGSFFIDQPEFPHSFRPGWIMAQRHDSDAHPTTAADDAAVPAATSRNIPKSTWVFAALIATLAAWAYWPTLVDLVGHWNSSPDYSHGYLVVPVAAWFLWRRRDRLPWSQIAPSWGGLWLLGAAALVRLAAARFYLPELDGWSLPL